MDKVIDQIELSANTDLRPEGPKVNTEDELTDSVETVEPIKKPDRLLKQHILKQPEQIHDGSDVLSEHASVKSKHARLVSSRGDNDFMPLEEGLRMSKQSLRNSNEKQ